MDIIKLSESILTILTYFVPGFACVSIYERTTGQKIIMQNDIAIIIYISISFAINVILSPVIRFFNINSLNWRAFLSIVVAIIIGFIFVGIYIIHIKDNGGRSIEAALINDLSILNKNKIMAAYILLKDNSLCVGQVYIIGDSDDTDYILQYYKIYRLNNDLEEEIDYTDSDNRYLYIKNSEIKRIEFEFLEIEDT